MRDYYDDSLFYCLDDGSSLLDGPASFPGGTNTAVLHSSVPSMAEQSTLVYQSQPGAQPPPSNSIAVLPFRNLSGDTSNEYFSDGLSEELLNVLSKIRGLRVAARTSAFSFKGKQSTINEIGSTLHVSSILDGSIRFSGNRIRVNVQLEDVSAGYQVWSATYDRTLDDVFAVQDDIAQAVVEEIRSHFLGDDTIYDSYERLIETEIADAMKGRTSDPEAQRLLMLGRYFLDRTNKEDGLKSISHFQQAVDLDPRFALGWAELSRALCVSAGKNWLPIDESYHRARTAAMKALEAEPALAEAHAQLGRIRAAYDLDLKAAAGSYAKALSLAPGNPVVADGASILELKLGNVDRAEELSRSVVDRDPLSGAVWHNLGLILHNAGKVDEAAKAFEKALELSPGRLVSSAMLAVVTLDQGDGDRALEQADHEPDDFWRSWARAIIHSRLGNKEKADEELDSLLKQATDGDAFQLAEVYAVRGDLDAAFASLDSALAVRDTGITHAKVSTHLRALYKDPRWTKLISAIGV